MLVSGGQILAIDKVNTGNTILGDGVQKPLDVNTDLIATTLSVSSVSSTLEHRIDAVSSKFNDYYPKTATSAAAEISAAFDKFKTTQTIVSAGKNIGVYSAYNEAGAIVYTVSAEHGEVKIVGDDGIRVSYDNTVSAWNIGVSANYQSAGNYVSADDFDKYKNDVTQKFDNTSAWVNETFQHKGEYVSATTFDEYKIEVQNTLNKKQDVSAMSAYAQSAWVDTNYQKKGNYVSADDFDEYKTKVEQIKEDVEGIESSLKNKKDKQTELNFNGSATKTIKNITQNDNGELSVEFEDIDLQQEVPNVEITSEDNSIKVTETTDVQTNTKKFDLSVKVDDPLEYGKFIATNVTSQAQLNKVNGNLDLNNYSIKLKKGNSYHFTVRGSYVANSAVNTYNTIDYIEPISFNNISVNVDNTITDSQFFEISYDVYNLSSDNNYNVAFASITGGKVSELWVEVHNLNGISVNGQGGSGTTYSAGDAIDLTNNTISVKYGKGLSVNSSNELEVNTDVIATMEYVNGMIGNVEIQLSEL